MRKMLSQRLLRKLDAGDIDLGRGDVCYGKGDSGGVAADCNNTR
jgi:hypothetical protein